MNPLNGPASPAGLPLALARYGHETTVRAGRAFQYQDDPCEAAFYLIEGTVRPVKFSSAGKPFDLPRLGPGQWFALAELVSGTACLFDAVADGPCRALAFTRANFERAMRDPDAVSAVLAALASEVLGIHRALADDDAAGKVLSFLLARRSASGGCIERACLRLTQAALADAVGLARETVNRHLRELEALGLVQTGRAEIGVPDWDALAAYAAGRERF